MTNMKHPSPNNVLIRPSDFTNLQNKSKESEEKLTWGKPYPSRTDKYSQTNDDEFMPRDNFKMKEMHVTLRKAETEKKILRSKLEQAERALEIAKFDLLMKELELRESEQYLSKSQLKLENSKGKLTVLIEQRKSLIFQLKSVKEVLMSSARNVQDLEFEAQKVPELQQRVKEFEQSDNLKKEVDHLMRRYT